MMLNDEELTILGYLEEVYYCPMDVNSLQLQSQLTGTIIDMYLKSITINTKDEIHTKNMKILPFSFYARLTSTTEMGKQINYGYDFSSSIGYTDLWTSSDFLKDIIIPIYKRGHWILIIINPGKKKTYVIDSFRQNRDDILKNIKEWYNTNMTNRKFDINKEEYNIYKWKDFDHTNIPNTVPEQTDGTSCGVFVSLTAYQWYQTGSLPDKDLHWSEKDVDAIDQNLRNHMLYSIVSAIQINDKKKKSGEKCINSKVVAFG